MPHHVATTPVQVQVPLLERPLVAIWAPGHLVLSERQVRCVATRPGEGEAPYVVDLDLVEVDVDAGEQPRLVTLRAAGRHVHLRTSKPSALVQQIVEARAGARTLAAA